MIDQKLKQTGHTWQSYSKLLGENPSNFKRKLLQNIEKINRWIEPLGLEIKIAPKSESREGKNKRKSEGNA